MSVSLTAPRFASMRLGALGQEVTDLEDIAQALRILLTTPVGSVPHRPTFGCNVWRWLDAPLSQVRPALTREIVDAVTQWEPRAELVEVQVLPGEPAGALRVTIVWRPLAVLDLGEGATVATVIALGGTGGAQTGGLTP